MRGRTFLLAFALAAVGAGAVRAMVTTYLPVLLERIEDAPALIGAVMMVNALAGFFVPLAVGLWSDRLEARRAGRRRAFLVGGAALAAGGLVGIALGSASSYAVLALTAAVVYSGLNAVTTSHRAMVAEGFEDGRRPAATSAQEVGMLAGGLLGLAAGGLLIEASPAALFAVGALVLVPLAAVSALAARRLPRVRGAARTGEPSRGAIRDLAAVMRMPGAREVLVAQLLWVGAYAALPTFFVLFAHESLGVGVGAAAALPAGFGLLTGVAMLAAGRAAPERVRGLLVAGVVLEAVGLASAAVAPSLVAALVPFAIAAVGLGLVTTLGFVYFARFVPDGEAGRFSGVFFATRAVASAVALPVAGLVSQATGSYRAAVAGGLLALPAVVPLLRAERGRPAPASAAPRRALPQTVAAVIPVHASARFEEVARGALAHVDEVLLVDDGAPSAIAAAVDAFARAEPRARALRLPENRGKGSAVAEGVRSVLAAARVPDAVLVLDSDGQHPVGRIPAFREALAEADVVIGARTGGRRGMPALRRLSNALANAGVVVSARRRVPDSQNGMRLYRAELLRRMPLPPGRYESETVHLKRLLRTGERVAWVPIPAIYEGEPSSFRLLADTARVAAAVLTPAGPATRERGASGARPRALGATLRDWSPRLLAATGAAFAVGLALPVLQPLDEHAFTRINGLGDGPELLYQAIDPHTRNYILIGLATVLGLAITSLVRRRRPRGRALGGAALAVVLAAILSDLVLEVFQITFDRPRPEEVLGEATLLSHDRTWSHIPSFPSGHLMVTGAMVAAATAVVPALRALLLPYLAIVMITRVLFGAHFPLDVLTGAVLGWEVGLVSVALVQAAQLLPGVPARIPRRRGVPQPATVEAFGRPG